MPVFSQVKAAKTHTYSVGANVYQGAVLAHAPEIRQFAPLRPVGFEVFMNRNSYGYTYHEDRYGCPDVGLALTYTDYRHPAIGKSWGATVYMDIPVARFRRSQLTLGLGTGLGYHTRPYRPTTEAANVMIGTPITLGMRAQVGYTYRLSSHWRALLSARLIHYSNASYTRPNRGVNMPNLQLGLSRVLGRAIPAYALASEVRAPASYQSLSYYLGFSSGLKMMKSEGERHHFINLHLYATYRPGPLSGFMAGVDVTWDNALRQYMRAYFLDSSADYRRVGLVVGHELFYHRLSMLTHVGIYIYRPFRNVYAPIYQRLGLRYALTKNLTSSVMLKVHGARAESLELGLGLRF